MDVTTPDSTTSYEQAVTNLSNSPNPNTALAGTIAGTQSQNVAQSGLSIAQLMAQIGEQPSQTQTQADYSTLGAGLQEAQLGLANENLGISQQGVTAQGQLQQTQYGLTQQGLAQQGQQQALANANQLTALHGQVATSGAQGTTGQKQQAYTQAAGNMFANNSLSLQGQGAAASNQYSVGQTARSQQQLQNSATANGISMDQLQLQLNQGVSQLGLGADQNLGTLTTQAAGAQGQQAQSAQQAIAQAGLLTNVNMNQYLQSLMGGQ